MFFFLLRFSKTSEFPFHSCPPALCLSPACRFAGEQPASAPLPALWTALCQSFRIPALGWGGWGGIVKAMTRDLPSEFASSRRVHVFFLHSFAIMSSTRNASNSSTNRSFHALRPYYWPQASAREMVFFQTGELLLHSHTSGAFAVYTTACTLPFIIRENVLRCSLRERNPLNYPLNILLHYFRNFRVSNKFNKLPKWMCNL